MPFVEHKAWTLFTVTIVKFHCRVNTDLSNNINYGSVPFSCVTAMLRSQTMSTFSFNVFKPDFHKRKLALALSQFTIDCNWIVLTKLAASIRVSSTLLSKYGNFWSLQKSNMVMSKMQTWGFKMGVHKSISDITVPMSIISAVYVIKVTVSGLDNTSLKLSNLKVN